MCTKQFCALFILTATCHPSIAQPLPFEREITSIEVSDEFGNPFERPFLGGFNIPRPQFVDIDADGDLDLFIQEKSGQIIFFEYDQHRSSFPFVWRTNHFNGLDTGEWYRFVDIDQDGDHDLISEQQFSLIQFHRNQGTPEFADYVLAADTLFDDLGEPVFSERQNIPTMTDIDCDGQLDLFTGRLDGTVVHFEVSGFNESDVPLFTLRSEKFQDILIVGETGKQATNRPNHGANTLTFIDFDNDGDEDLFWGDFFESGLLLLENVGTCEAPDFSSPPVKYPLSDPLQTSGYNAPAFGDVDGDGHLDLLVGVLGGAFSATASTADNLLYYAGSEGGMTLQTHRYLSNLDFGSDTIPVLRDLDADGDLDLMVTNSIDPGDLATAKAYVFENRGSFAEAAFFGIGEFPLEPAFNYAPAFADLDGDGDDDLLVGSWGGPIAFYRKANPPDSGYVLVDASYLDLPDASNTTPALVDIDGDNDYDVIAGEAKGTLNFYENIGSSTAPSFAPPREDWSDIDAGRRSIPVFVDIDLDGDQDLVLGSDQDGVQFYRNNGDVRVPQFVAELLFDLPDVRRATPALADIDADGDLDLMLGTLEGGLHFYKNQAVQTSVATHLPSTLYTVFNYPNPAREKTTFYIGVEQARQVKITLFDLTGRQIKEVYVGQVNASGMQIDLDMRHLPAGVYYLKLSDDRGSIYTHALVHSR